MHLCFRKALALAASAALTLLPAGPVFAAPATPIQHLVIIFQENVSFDHYFGTYPKALNPAGEPSFIAKHGTATVNGFTPALLTDNPNLNPGNGAGKTNPFRLDRTQAVTRDQGHGYLAEQEAFAGGVMDLFPRFVGKAGPPPAGTGITATTGLNLGYFDGNTVTALWNYAHQYAMSDNSFSTGFGPSTPGALNLISGQTNGAINISAGAMGAVTDGGAGSFTVIGDPDPTGDMCSGSSTLQMKGTNIGDLLNAAGVTWGSFMGGFDLTAHNADGSTGCGRTSTGLPGFATNDYIPHHAWFQYYPTTANPMHTRPASVAEIGGPGQANHEYDLNDFFAAVSAGNFPAVSFLKAQAYQDGHAGYSDPLDEQTFLVNTINFLEQNGAWANTAVVIMYDDSDGWYDHQIGPIVNQSQGDSDGLTGAPQFVGATGYCGSAANLTALPGVDATNPHALGRCGFGPRQPLLVISPWARQNFVDHLATDQTSVLRFIEDNWLAGQRIGQGSFDSITSSIDQLFDFAMKSNTGAFLLDPNTGVPR